MTEDQPYGASMAAAYQRHMEKHRRICAEAREEDACIKAERKADHDNDSIKTEKTHEGVPVF